MGNVYGTTELSTVWHISGTVRQFNMKKRQGNKGLVIIPTLNISAYVQPGQNRLAFYRSGAVSNVARTHTG